MAIKLNNLLGLNKRLKLKIMLTFYTHQNQQLITQTTPDAATLWVDMLQPTAAEDQQVEAFLGISIPTKDDMAEIELSARLYQEDNAEFMTATVIVNLDGEEPHKAPITFILKNNVLITVRYETPKPFNSFITRAQKLHGNLSSTAPLLFLGLLEACVARMADSLEKMSSEMDVMSRQIFRQRTNTNATRKTVNLQVLLRQIGSVGDILSLLKESLVSISRVNNYYHAINLKTTKDIAATAKMLQRDVGSLSEHTTALNQKITFLLDATLGLINLEQNQIIKMFSVAAVVFLPPTLVASIYGMNFEHMPELKWLLGYPWALGLMVISAILPYAFSKKRGWL